ncbi:DNA adenine methylase [Maricaulis sp.]|uniref:DNA adenine methylase n=1 Tax=Maricaulis sp. TaxID=1486257 RepID=UPI003A8EA8F7
MTEILLPFLKWAGGKRWLVSEYLDLFPKKFERLIEPFTGSGAVFFALRPPQAVLADLNPRIIGTYLAIRDELPLFVRYFNQFARSHSREQYYEVRQKVYKSRARSAAQFLYLNRVCFNGIYRENLKGQFNVPLGSKSKATLATDRFVETSRMLSGVDLVVSDFERIIDSSKEGDFVYVDPPYTTKHNLNGFIKYNQKIFSWSDQERLARAVIAASARGALVMVSNADHEDVAALYRGHLRIEKVERINVLSATAVHRGRVTELVATNV